ncbi:hypothetical protein LSTR_LSTR000993 [Laodelphax striatellus]|uniref:C2H2-type domain-containing protein n=1 Tax=Laodelphax striatellus TaxID=195883 RepID=A0A482X1E3_LAOST|nr:hypothetical protein LSTR_LSTR000993 [Laodelphax striatellus]
MIVFCFELACCFLCQESPLPMEMVEKEIYKLSISELNTGLPKDSRTWIPQRKEIYSHHCLDQPVDDDDVVTSQRRFACPACSKTYSRTDSVARHRRYECGNKAPQFQCPFCPQIFLEIYPANSKIQQIEEIYSIEDDPGKRFACPKCNRSYRGRNGLQQHMKFECGKEPQFSCTLCPKKFHRKSTLKSHLICVHTSRGKFPDMLLPTIKIFENDSNQSFAGDNLKKSYPCLKCNARSYSSKTGLSQHLRLECGMEPRFECSVCGHRFHRSTTLKTHFALKHMKNNWKLTTDLSPHPRIEKGKGKAAGVYSCHVCNKQYNSRQGLGLHRRNYCGQEPRFTCDICGQKFFQLGHMRTHRMCNLNDCNEYACPQCGNSYRRRGDMMRHLRYECGRAVPKYQCPHCPHTSKRMTNLRVHISAAHPHIASADDYKLARRK